MRHPKKYVAKNGDVSYRVRYRGSNGAEKSETFYSPEAADEFAYLVKALGPARALAYIDARIGEQVAAGSALTVNDLFDKWHAFKSHRNKKGELTRVRSARTLIDYRRMYEAHIKPVFGNLPANLVSPMDVQTWVDELDLAAKTVAHYHSLLHGLYKWGVHPTRGIVVVDPCTETQLPKRRKTPPKGLRPAEWQILLAAAKEVDADVADLLLFFASTGWRWSEAVAVRVMDVDFDGDRVYVTMGRVLRREGNTYEFVDDSKSEAGMRRIRLLGESAPMVMRRIHGRRPSDLIFTTKQGSRWNYVSFHKRYWTRPAKNDDAPKRKRVLEVAKEMGLDRPDITPYWLRHTQAGMMILAGEPLPAIQRRLGHASIKTTVDTYGRMVDDASDEGAERMAVMLDGPKRAELEG